jgi:hypothetical protein
VLQVLRRRTTPNVVVGVVTFLSCLYFWSAHWAAKHLNARFLNTYQTSKRPVPLNGLHIPIDQLFGVRDGDASAYVLLVSSDECHFSREMAASWEQWLAKANVDR